MRRHRLEPVAADFHAIIRRRRAAARLRIAIDELFDPG